MLPNIHILGIQGSGKGTQSSLLVEKLGLTYASSGNLFRQRALIEDEFGKELAAQLRIGKLLPNELLFETIDHFLNEHAVSVGFLGDGVIRTKDQHAGLLSIWKRHELDLPFLIHLDLTEDVALKRIEQRVKDQEDPSKLAYHKVYSGKLVQRNDDNPLAIEERFRIFHTLTRPVISEFRQEGRYAYVSADQSVDAIHKDILTILKHQYPSLSHGTH